MQPTTEQQVIGLPFVDHVDQSARPTISNPQLFLSKAYYQCSMSHSLLNSGCYKLMGYRYDFRQYLKKYVYKVYGNWYEAYAPNKTLLRKAIHGTIEKIVQI
jgi:hypothetical protein